MIERIREILRIIEEKSEKKTIVVFKGFPYSNLVEIENKYFKNWSKMIVNETDIEDLRSQILHITFEIMNSDNKVFWMTYEELIISYEIIKNNFDIKILENSIFNKRYPYDGTIADIEAIYKNCFYNVEDEIKDEQAYVYSVITDFYGEISYSNETNQYYIVYNDSLSRDIGHMNLYEIKENEHAVEMVDELPRTEGTLFLELSEDEMSFLDLITNLLFRKDLPSKVCIITMVQLSDLPNLYRERTEILQSLFIHEIEFYFAMKKMEVYNIEKLPEYKAILKKYWGFDSFRNLHMYSDVRSRDRKIVKISQAQIINDVVEQTSLALEGKGYRDVFITSPTGSGKSVMFQIPSIYLLNKYKELNPLTIVISPLIALMNDQIDSLKKNGIDIARTINSNTLPFEREKILGEVENGTCSILYLSPETLQSRYDIKVLIGNRNLGLVIIDEAHIVTTWGKTFRADYWYLGIYLQKLRKQYRFPIVTFTATAIYGGREDMYLETRDSLNMINPISYFGNVKRDDIYMLISSADTGKAFEKNSRDYRKAKQQLALEHLESAYSNNQKSLVYFPTISTLKSFNTFIKLNNKDIFDKTGQYHGMLQKEEKDEVLSNYKEGDMQFVLATKAFGMGVDIPDIKYVYHYAPTGSVTDYIQEIGRVARNKELVKMGVARCDFLPRDFNEVKRLYGMSSIKNRQLLQVMDKIVQLYKEKGHNRNLIVRAEDFKYAFMEDDEEMDGLDNKIKTALLLIEKDFSSSSNIGYPPFVARPRGIFGNEMILVKNDFAKKMISSSLKFYVKREYELKNSIFDGIYSVKLSELWEDHYKNYTFPNFKRMLFNPEEYKDLKHRNLFSEFSYSTGISIVRMRDDEINDAISMFNRYIKVFSEFSAEKKRLDKYFTVNELGSYLSRHIKIQDKFKARSIAQSFINSCFEYQKIKDYRFIKERSEIKEVMYKYQNSYDIFIDFATVNFANYFKDKKQYYEDNKQFIKFYLRNKSSQFHQDIIVLGLAESIGLVHYNVENGNSPQIYLRINSILPMEQAIKKGEYYNNNLLNNIYLRHRISVEMLTYLFTYKVEAASPQEEILKYTEFFWSKIEDYFLGDIPTEVEENIYKKRS
ncbi:DEAD/DEAH box helicase [Clostridium algidicarnis]|uniref:DEAD/DEAH box helicase n=1 Tax=Clostridium algidicarnis TaxID=37659 RepID=UPI001C0C014A|nr:DEAD/DEAH box helicase [Clostridium algidicarnis]MBU3227083.1 DEAD/DEAH box helicase [Clostridium algidicarnis]MBU3250608.1 DEAD/DEAH box helicase [Clostridium algidicarnis]